MNDLIERYIYAVARRLPKKQREDVSQELRGLIEDMLAERCQGRIPQEKDVRVVLTELGSPQELYAKYDENSEKCLIGPPYYAPYTFVMKIALIGTAAGLTIANLILGVMEPQANVFETLLSWFSIMWNGLLSAFAIVTLLFAFFYRKEIKLGTPFNFDDLPPVPKKQEEISKWECIAGIVFNIFFAVLFLAVPQLIFVLPGESGKRIPIFDVEAIRDTWYIIVIFAVCGITREIIALMEGRYNKKVFLTDIVTDGISAVLSIWWLTGFRLMNPVFTDSIAQIFQGDRELVVQIFSHFQSFFLVCILFALTLDLVTSAVRTLKK